MQAAENGEAAHTAASHPHSAAPQPPGLSAEAMEVPADIGSGWEGSAGDERDTDLPSSQLETDLASSQQPAAVEQHADRHSPAGAQPIAASHSGSAAPSQPHTPTHSEPGVESGADGWDDDHDDLDAGSSAAHAAPGREPGSPVQLQQPEPASPQGWDFGEDSGWADPEPLPDQAQPAPIHEPLAAVQQGAAAGSAPAAMAPAVPSAHGPPEVKAAGDQPAACPLHACWAVLFARALHSLLPALALRWLDQWHGCRPWLMTQAEAQGIAAAAGATGLPLPCRLAVLGTAAQLAAAQHWRTDMLHKHAHWTCRQMPADPLNACLMDARRRQVPLPTLAAGSSAVRHSLPFQL